jgi:hypothetical protein
MLTSLHMKRCKLFSTTYKQNSVIDTLTEHLYYVPRACEGSLRSRQWAAKLAHNIILESIAGIILTWQISPQSGKAESMLHAFAAKEPAQMLWALNANKSYYMSKELICIKLLENCDLSNRVKCNFEFVVQRSDWMIHWIQTLNVVYS